MTAASQNRVRPTAPHLRVLVVEGDARTARATLQAVGGAGSEWLVQSARSPTEATRLVRDRPWDALLVAEPVWERNDALRRAVETRPEVAVVLVRDSATGAPSALPVVSRDELADPRLRELVLGAVRRQRRLRRRETMLRWLEREARTDPVTGLANRLAFDEQFAWLCTEARTNGEPVALVVFDVVGMRVINEVHGRDVGDRVLHRVGRALQTCVRAGDSVARVSADRFAVALGGATLDTARRVARRVTHELERASHEEGEVPVAVSIAVAASFDPDPVELWDCATAQLKAPHSTPLPLAAFLVGGSDDGPSVA